MHDAVFLQVEKTADDLMHVVSRLVLVETALALEIGAELAVLGQLQHQVHIVFVLDERVQLEYGRMFESHVRANLVFDAFDQVVASR